MSASQPTSTDVDPERQPLLAPQDPPSYSKAASDSDDTAVEVEITAADEEAAIPAEADQLIELPKKKTTSVWLVLWYLLILAIASLAIGFFVKGFMDADDVDFDLGKALKSALGGGLSGAAAMVLQVLTLMPLRTIMNYQYRYGTTTTHATLTLWREGGFSRYYQGLLAALIQGPVSRFGDTAANAGILALLSSNTFMRSLPTVVKSVFASIAAALFRMILTPIDTVKTTLQTQGKRGWGILRTRVRVYGLASLFYGAWATAAATFVGHFPWFGTYNFLQENLPPAHTLIQTLLRQAFIGFVASVISDTVSNSLRVVKTYRQVNETRVGYVDAARAVIATDGVRGLFGRGLKTRIIANGCQGLMFSILWKLFMDLWNDKTK